MHKHHRHVFMDMTGASIINQDNYVSRAAGVREGFTCPVSV